MATDILKEQYDNLLEEHKQLKKLNLQQKDNLISLDKEVTVIKRRIREKVAAPVDIQKQQRTRIQGLGNKFTKDTAKFDELLYSNTEYRKDIDCLLQLKGLWCHMEEKLNRQLATQQNITEKLEERSILAFNQRSAAESQMLEVQKCIKVETAQFTKKRMRLKNAIAHDAKLQTFLEAKLQEIIPSEEDEDSKKREKQQQYESGVQQLEMYKQEHRTLVEVNGETDLQQIGLMFAQIEQKNFAHISYINELHNKRNTLKNRTDKMKSDILLLEEENKGHDEQINSQRKDLECELEKYSCLPASLEEQCSEVQRTLDQLMTATHGLLGEIMQEAVDVNVDNITHSIGVLEEKINDLLIRATNVDDEHMKMDPEMMLLANSDLLPELEAVVETQIAVECRKSASRSPKSAGSDRK